MDRAYQIPPAASPGRPRSLRAKRAVMDAVRALVEHGGYSAVTIEAVVARSGVARTTIYRWWPNRAAMAVDLLMESAAQVAPPSADPDPLRGLRNELRLVAAAAEGFPGRLLISLLGEAEHDPDIHGALQLGLFTPRRQAVARVIRRAQLAGSLRRDVAPLLAADLLYGPLFYRKFIRHEPVTKAFVRQAFQSVLAGLRVQRAKRSRTLATI